MIVPITAVYYAAYHAPLPTARFSQLLQEVPYRFRERIIRFRRWQDAHASLLGKLLLLHAFKDSQCDATLDDITYTKYGRPYVSNAPDFNISHSGEMVVCAISHCGRIGIDIELCSPITTRDFKRQFSAAEWHNIEQSSPQEFLFYKYWTMKEAILKADGRGIFTSLSKINVADGTVVLPNGLQWHITSIYDFENYICHIASENLYQKPCIRKISFT